MTTDKSPGDVLFLSNKMPGRLRPAWHKAMRGALALLILPLCTAHAQTAPDLNAIQRQNDAILRQQQDQLRQDQLNAQRPLPPGGESLRPPASTAGNEQGPCRDIKTIDVTGAKHLPAGTLQTIVVKFEGRCLTASDIEQLLTEITGAYFKRGDITTRAYLPAQSLTAGVLKITVVEGVIEGYRFDAGKHNRIGAWGVFPASPGELLNLRDLEQGIDQINRATANNARMDIEPGDNPGESWIQVHNQAGFPLQLMTSYDNQSVDSTGRLSGMATVTEDGLLGLNEIVSVTHRQTLPYDSAHDSKSDALDVVLPFGYNTLTFDLSDMRYNSLIDTAGPIPLLSQGETITRSLDLDRVVFRNHDSKVSVSATLTDQATSADLDGQYLSVGSRDLDFIDLGVDVSTVLMAGMSDTHVDLVQGLPILDALRDPGDLPGSLPHAQFTKVTLDENYTKPFVLLGQNLTWTSHLSAQYAMTTLFGSEQIAIGGPTSVRGYLDSILSGDTGIYFHNDIGKPFALSALGGLSGRVYAGFDVGSVTNRAPGVPGGTMGGATLGIAWQWHQLTGDCFIAHGLFEPAALPHEPTRVFFRVSYAI